MEKFARKLSGYYRERMFSSNYRYYNCYSIRKHFNEFQKLLIFNESEKSNEWIKYRRCNM